MSAIIDGVEYHKVIRSFTIGSDLYAQIEQPEIATPGFNRIVDGDGDTWYPAHGTGRWTMRENSTREGETRETVNRLYRIAREYTE